MGAASLQMLLVLLRLKEKQLVPQIVFVELHKLIVKLFPTSPSEAWLC